MISCSCKNSMADEEKKEDDKKEAVEHINIKVTASDGNEVHFRVKPNTPFRKIFTAYCERLGKTMNDVRFMWDGRRVEADQTPNELDLEDGDRIEAMVEQLGGF